MGESFSIVRGDAAPVSLPGYADDQIEIGDLLWWDGTNDAVRPASEVSGGTYDIKKTALADAFVGVALSGKAADESRNILVGTSGDYLFSAPTGEGADAETLDYVGGGDGTDMLDQTVNVVDTPDDAIGRVIGLKATTDSKVMVRILSRLNHLEAAAST